MKLLEPSSPAFDHPRKKAIHEWDTGDRPREKFMNEGADALSPAELLAILVGSGNDREDAVTVLAACELGARRHTEDADTEQFDCSQKIYRFFYEKLRDAPVEEAHVLLLNNNLRFIRSVQVCRGGIDSTTVDVRIVLREALVSNAVHIALCHNHPSGNPQPSRADDHLTDELRRACDAVQLRLIDHIVLADGNYYSYADAGRL